jgi:hypothetical protein
MGTLLFYSLDYKISVLVGIVLFQTFKSLANFRENNRNIYDIQSM